MFQLYGLIIGIAVVVGWELAERQDSRVGKIAPYVIGLGLVGARLYHVVDLWEYYAYDWQQILMIWQGGLSIWGALIGGLVGWKIAGGDWQMLEVIVSVLPLSQAIGRLANAVNNEFGQLVYGIPWWGMEAILDLALFCLMWVFPRDKRVILYLVGYGLIRLVLSPYR